MATSPAPPVVFQIVLHHNLRNLKCFLLSCSSVKNGSDRRKIPLGSVSQQTPVIHRQILSQFLCQMPSLTQHCPLFQALFWLYVDLGMMSHSGLSVVTRGTCAYGQIKTQDVWLTDTLSVSGLSKHQHNFMSKTFSPLSDLTLTQTASLEDGLTYHPL